VLEKEKTSEIAQRKGAIFAVNAGFFAQDGDPLGTLMIDGRILSEPQEGWYSVGITENNQLLFGELKFKAQAQHKMVPLIPLPESIAVIMEKN